MREMVRLNVSSEVLLRWMTMRRPPSIEDVSSQESAAARPERPELLAQAAAFCLADEVEGVAADQAVGGGVMKQRRVAFGLDDAAAASVETKGPRPRKQIRGNDLHQELKATSLSVRHINAF